MKVVKISTKHFFNHEFNRLCCLAGMHPADLLPCNLANLHPCKVGDKNGLSGEAVNYTYCMALALNDCQNASKKPYRTILIDYFFKSFKVHKIMAKIGYSERQYYRFEKSAIREFSDLFKHYQVKMNLNEVVKLTN